MHDRKDTTNTRRTFPAPYSLGTPDNPNARAEYEWLRLHDPSTGKIPKNIRAKELAFAARLPKKFEASAGKKVEERIWQERGPFNVGGRTRAFAMDVEDEYTLLAGGVSGGMWRSGDMGGWWEKMTTPEQLHSVTCIAQDIRPGRTNVWYYGTGEMTGNSASGGYFVNDAHFSGDGIYKSIDGGFSWERLQSTYSGTPTDYFQNLEFDYVWRIVTDPVDTINDVVYAAVFNGIYRSIDEGETWEAVLGLDTNFASTSRFTDIAITTVGVLYATVSSEGPVASEGIWRSEDGVNWTNIQPSTWPATYRRIVLGIAPSNEDIVYFLGETPGSGLHEHSLFKYTYLTGDGADSNGVWEDRTANLPTYDCTGFYTFEFGSYNSQSSYDMFIKVHPYDEEIVFLGGTNIYRSLDGFATDTEYSWIGGYYCDSLEPSNYVYPGHHPDQHELLFLPSDTFTMLSANDGGMSITYDNMAEVVEWEFLNNGYLTTQFYTVAIEPGDISNDIIIGGMQDNGTWMTISPELDTLWKNVFYGDGAYCAITEGREFYYVSWQGGKTFKFTIDSTGIVTGLTRIDPTAGSGFAFINPFILDPNNYDIMYMIVGNYLWRNDVLGEIPITNDEYNSVDSNWVKITQSASTGISALGMSQANPDRVIYGTRLGKLYKLDSSASSAPIKTEITGTDFPNAYISCVSVDPYDGDRIIVIFSNYNVMSIFYTEDAGITWESVSGNLEEFPDGSGNGPSVRWAAFLHLADYDVYYVGTSTGLYATADLNGDSTIWELEAPLTIGNVVVEMVVTRDYDSLVIAATHGTGIYSFSPDLGIDTSYVDTSDTTYFVYQNFPNPFRNETRINFEVNKEARVDCRIYDISGKEVAVLIDEVNPPGQHFIIWDGRDSNGNKLGDGIYMYRILVGKVPKTKKMVLLK
ncbi:T9SS type A sorting domain-containing protein [Candidatus Amoebophilus asiaticus]|nr:T9SS type A sorting domain-containing protein [Candidatus Amoebophilus asiaticus]